MTRRLASRREVALVACALLVPIPVLAASGLGIPLPSVVERGLASLLPLPGGQETSRPDSESGTAAATVGSTGGPAAEGRAAVPDPEGAEPPGTDISEAGAPGGSTETTVRGGGTTGSGESDEEGGPPTGEDTPPSEEPLPTPDPPAVDTPAAGPAAEAPVLDVTVAGTEVTVDEDGVSADAPVGGDDVGVSVVIGADEGQPPDVDVTLPGSGLGIP